MVQVRFIPGFYPFCSEEMLAHIFFMCVMLQSLWQTLLTSLFLYSLSKTTPSLESFSSISTNPCQNCSPWTLEKQVHQGPIFQFLSHHIFRKWPSCTSSGHFQDVLSAVGSVLPYTPLSSPLFLVHFFLSALFLFLICHPVYFFSVAHPLLFLWFYKQKKY